MLQHVLKEMRIDRELLDGLDDFEKEKLFCRMRGEQIRRWKEWDTKETEAMKNQSPRINRIGKKCVKWLCDESGEPIVNVIHRPIEDDVTDAKEKDGQSNDQDYEQKELRLTVKDGRCIDLSHNEAAHKLSKYVNVVSNHRNSSPSVILNFADKRGALQELSLNKVPKVARQVAEWEKRVTQDDSKTLNRTLEPEHNTTTTTSMTMTTTTMTMTTNNESLVSRRSSDTSVAVNDIQHQLWREQQKIANETEMRIRTIARLAREEHRRLLMVEKQNKINNNQNSSTTVKNNSSIDDIKKNILKPPSNETILNWYRTKELPKNAGLQSNNQVADWFYGLFSRKEAEGSLTDEKEGTFMVRIAERLWSYTISCKTSQGIKHYLVDASNGNYYQLLVNDQTNHYSLDDLVSYHKTHPLIANGNEFLLYPCLKNRNLSTLLDDEPRA